MAINEDPIVRAEEHAIDHIRNGDYSLAISLLQKLLRGDYEQREDNDSKS